MPQKNTSPDVIVIGGGIIGLSCALELANRGLKITVFEKDGPISGASNLSLGVLCPPSPLNHRPFQTLHRKSLALFGNYTRSIEEASGIKNGFYRCGSLEVLPSEAQYNHALEEMKYINALPEPRDPFFEYHLLTQAEAKEREPEANIKEFGALYCPISAWVDVDKLMEGLKKACQRAGVTLEWGVDITKLTYDGQKVTGVEFEQGTLRADKVLVACGAWSSQFTCPAGIYTNIHPVRGQAILVRCEKPLVNHIVKWRRRYVIPYGPNHVALGSTTEKKSGYDISVTTDGLHSILDTTMAVVPGLKGCAIERTWAGLRPAGKDSRPHMGQIPGIEGLYAAAGHYKIGICFAPMSAKIIADLIVEGSSEDLLESIKPRIAAPPKKKKQYNE